MGIRQRMKRDSARKWLEKIAFALCWLALAGLAATVLYTAGLPRSTKPDPLAERVIPFMSGGVIYVSPLDMTILHALFFLTAAFALIAVALFAAATLLKSFSGPN
jgi:hypothetical protein